MFATFRGKILCRIGRFALLFAVALGVSSAVARYKPADWDSIPTLDGNVLGGATLDQPTYRVTENATYADQLDVSADVVTLYFANGATLTVTASAGTGKAGVKLPSGKRLILRSYDGSECQLIATGASGKSAGRGEDASVDNGRGGEGGGGAGGGGAGIGGNGGTGGFGGDGGVNALLSGALSGGYGDQGTDGDAAGDLVVFAGITVISTGGDGGGGSGGKGAAFGGGGGGEGAAGGAGGNLSVDTGASFVGAPNADALGGGKDHDVVTRQIALDMNGQTATSAGHETVALAYAKGEGVYLAEGGVECPTAADAIFDGYYTASVGGVMKIDATGVIIDTDVSGLTKLYAHWLEGVSAHFVVTTLDDPADDQIVFYDGVVSLREAVRYAQLHPDRTNPWGTRTITFEPTLFTNALATITLTRELSDDLGAGSIEIAGPTNGVDRMTLSGGGTTRLFDQTRTETTLRLENLTLTDGQGDENGGGLVRACGKLTVAACTFTNGFAGSGGAIYADGSLAVTNTAFADCRCGTGTSCAGGAIYSRGPALLKGCLFRKNYSGWDGAAVYFSASTLVQRIVDSCSFIENVGRNEVVSCFGGTCLMVNSTFVGNHAATGIVSVRAPNTVLNVVGSTFRGNTLGPVGHVLGAYDGGVLRLLNVICTEQPVGGAIGKDTSATIEAVRSAYRSAVVTRATACVTGLTEEEVFSRASSEPLLTVEDQPLRYIEPLRRDVDIQLLLGAEVWHDATYENIAYRMQESDDMIALQGDAAKATQVLETDISDVKKSHFVPCFGSCWMDPEDMPRPDPFTANVLFDALSSNPYNVVVTLRDAVNYALQHPDERSARGTREVTVDPSLFTNDLATITLKGPLTDGAASDAKTLEISGPADSAQTLVLSGGGTTRIFNQTRSDTTVYLKNLTLKGGNAGTGNGGACYATGSLVVEDCLFDGCAAREGGAIYAAGPLAATNSIFTTCVASENKGGAIHAAGPMRLKGCLFEENCGSNHIVLYGSYSSLFLVDSCSFVGNTGNFTVFLYGGAGAIVNSTFIDNTASTDVVATYSSSVLNVVNSTFRGNTPGEGDGTIFRSYDGSILRFLNVVCVRKAGLADISRSYGGTLIAIRSAYGYCCSNITKTDCRTGVTDSIFANPTCGQVTVPGSEPPQLVEPLKLSDQGLLLGARVWHDADWQNIVYALPGSSEKAVLCGEADKATLALDTDISGVRQSGYVTGMGSWWMAAYPSLTVTTTEVSEDPYDGLATLPKVFAYTSVRAGESAARGEVAAPWTIRFDDGLYDTNGVAKIAPSYALSDTVGLTPKVPYEIGLEGPSDDGKSLTLDGGGTTRLFTHTRSDTTVHLKNLTLTGGNAGTENGGACYATGSLVVEDCLFDGCAAGSGGAIYASGPLAVTNGVFSNCSCDGAQGGAVSVLNGPVRFKGCLFQKNANSHCSALYASGVTPLVVDACSFVENAPSGGSSYALYVKGGSCSIVNSTFVKNTAQEPLCIESGVLNIVGSTFRGNTPGKNSPVVAAHNGGTLRLLNDVFCGNDGNRDIGSDKCETVPAAYRCVYHPSKWSVTATDCMTNAMEAATFSRSLSDPLMSLPCSAPRYVEPLVAGSWATTGAVIKADADWQNVQYALPGKATFEVLCGVKTRARTPLTTDITGLDRSNGKGLTAALKPAAGSLWPGDLPSMTVSTLEDKVDVTDGLLSLREVVDYAKAFPAMAENGQFKVAFSEKIYSGANFVTCRWARTQIEVKDLRFPLVLASPAKKTIVLDGDGRWRHFRVWPGNRLDLNGVKLVNGFGADYGSPLPGTDGGSILNNGVLNALNCHFCANRAGGRVVPLMNLVELSGDGGAIWTAPTAKTLAHWSCFSRNAAANGGAMAGLGEQTAASVTFSENTAGAGTAGGSEGKGGAAYVTGGDAAFLHCTMVGNDAGVGGAGGAVYAETGTRDTVTPLHFASSIVVGNRAGATADDIRADGAGAIDLGCVAVGVTNGTAKTWYYADSSYFGVLPNQLFPDATTTSAQVYRQMSGVGHVYYPVYKTTLDQGARIGLKTEGQYDGIYFEYKPNDWMPIRGPGGRCMPGDLYNDNRDQLFLCRERFLGAVTVIGQGGGDPLPPVPVDTFVVTQATWTAFVDTVNRLAASGPKANAEITFADAAANATITAGDPLVLTAFTNVPLAVRGPVTFKGSDGRRFVTMNLDNDAVFRNVRFESGGSTSLTVGGAIYGAGGNHLSTSNCVFKGNKAMLGGAVGMEDGGDGRHATILYFYKTDFVDNVATIPGYGNDVYQARGTIEITGGSFDPSGFKVEQAQLAPYTLTTATGTMRATTLTGVQALLSDGEAVTAVSGPTAAAPNLAKAVSAAYQAKSWFTVTTADGTVKAELNEQATPQAAELTVSPGESGEISLTPGNVKPGLWYALEKAESPVGPYVTVEDSWVRADAEGNLAKPLVAPAEGVCGFYRVIVRESR